MLCIKPFRTAHGEFGCGQCMPCRINRRREWTSRIVLEAGLWTANAFVTLTYKDVPYGHHGPPQRHVWELTPKHLRQFMRVLWDEYPMKVRYYAVGEYGEKNMRPHWHLALFNFSYLDLPYLQKAWPHGEVHVGDLNAHSASYIAGYVCKKMTHEADPRLGGRQPELARMSNRPGIGRGAMKVIAGSLQKLPTESLFNMEDVPCVARVEGKVLPMGRYLTQNLRKEMGYPMTAPQEKLRRKAAEYGALSTEDHSIRDVKRVAQYDSALARVKIKSTRRKL